MSAEHITKKKYKTLDHENNQLFQYVMMIFAMTLYQFVSKNCCQHQNSFAVFYAVFPVLYLAENSVLPTSNCSTQKFQFTTSEE